MTVWRRRKDKKPPEPAGEHIWFAEDLLAIARAAQADSQDEPVNPHEWTFSDTVHEPTKRMTWEP